MFIVTTAGAIMEVRTVWPMGGQMFGFQPMEGAPNVIGEVDIKIVTGTLHDANSHAAPIKARMERKLARLQDADSQAPPLEDKLEWMRPSESDKRG